MLEAHLKIQKDLSEGGFEPPPTYHMDQNTPVKERDLTLESGALDRSAILSCYLVVDKVKISPKL